MSTKAKSSTPLVRRYPETPRELDRRNIEKAIEDYTRKVARLRLGSIAGLKGHRLLLALKRAKVQDGPWPEVSWVEAANRIMSDLVILYGVRWMLRQKRFPFKSYFVQLGTENKKPFDIEAKQNGLRLVGEAFNVAEWYFPTKMRRTLVKLRRSNVKATHRVVIYNVDMKDKFTPSPVDREVFAVVDVIDGSCSLVPARSRG